MNLYSISLELTIEAPFATHSSDPGAAGIDTPLARNSGGTLVIPGTLILGRLREAWESPNVPVTWQTKAKEWCGEPAKAWQPITGRLMLDDLVLEAEDPKPGQFTRVEVDSAAGAVARGSLQVIEQPFAIGAQLKFAGSWRAYATEHEIEELVCFTKKGIYWAEQVGSMRSVGFGQVVSVEVRATKVTAPSVAGDRTKDGGNTVPTRIELELDFERRPFCVPLRPLAGGNLFVTGDHLPGHVVKSAIAMTWAAMLGKRLNEHVVAGWGNDALAKHFSDIIVSAAHPSSDAAARPLPAPHSWVKAGGDILDAALLDTPCLVNDAAPAFAIDWKDADYAAAAKVTGWPWVDRGLRVHTAIASKIRRADEGELFAYELAMPAQGQCWRGYVDLSAISAEKRPAAIKKLQCLLANGLHFIGKTKTWATCKLTFADRKVDQIGNAGPWVVQLVTPALLTSHTECYEVQQGKYSLHKLYEKVWGELTGGAASLSHFYARQQLSGGAFSFQNRQSGEGTYRPAVLTEAGSVFVLGVAEGKTCMDVQSALQGLQQTNLWLRKLVKDEHGECWTANSWQPTNGFGEIAVNEHSRRKITVLSNLGVEKHPKIEPVEVAQ